MATPNGMDPMLEAFLFDTEGQIDNLEQAVLSTEDEGYTEEIVNDIFRYMHTIKGSSAMMMFNNISTAAHSTEDLFFFIRENKATNFDRSTLCDIVLEAIDFIKLELEKIKNGDPADGDESEIIKANKAYLENLKATADGAVVEAPKKAEASKPKPIYVSSSTVVESGGTPIYKAKVFFEEDAKMENIRAFVLVNNLKDITQDIKTVPKNVIDDENGAEIIARDGFLVYFKAEISKEEAENIIKKTPVVDKFELTVVEDAKEYDNLYGEEPETKEVETQAPIVPQKVKLEDAKGHETSASAQSMISINVSKLDSLMDLVGELVIAEAMVTQNPDIQDLELENFSKAARQLQKIAKSIQDNVLGMRLVPLKATFMKMNRTVRDMNRKLDKKVHLRMIGENTEVDKNIIEHIGDPIMHIVRNALDHGIESNEERISAGKSEQGLVTLEAKNVGNEVHIIISDDGKGLDRTKLLKKAQENELLKKPPEEMSDQEVYNLILLPGFSTKKEVSEFSGRGVGMDVVCKNIEAIGGTLDINSEFGAGTTFRMKIPLTLAIIAGMSVKIGDQHYTLPISGIKELVKPDTVKVFKNANNSEMVMIRGECYPILRLSEFFDVETEVTDFNDGMFIMVETSNQTVCLFCDQLIGKQQIVVKSLPDYFDDVSDKLKGISGCTLLGNGSISLIIDVNSLTT